MKFIQTMNFNGQCREAMEMYREAFVDRFGIRWGIMTETAE